MCKWKRIAAGVAAAFLQAALPAVGGDAKNPPNWGQIKEVEFKALKKDFKTPDMIYAPFIFWFWDEPLNPDKMAEMSRVMCSEGFNPGYAHALSRIPVFPEVPTLIESGVAGYEATTWHGVVVPAGTPKAIVAVLNTRLNRAVNSTAATERILALGSEPLTGTPEAFWELVRIDSAIWAEVIRKAGAKID